MSGSSRTSGREGGGRPVRLADADDAAPTTSRRCPGRPASPTLSLPAARLGEMIARRSSRSTSDDTRYFLNGVLLVRAATGSSRSWRPTVIGWRSSSAKREGRRAAPRRSGVILPKKTRRRTRAAARSRSRATSGTSAQENHLFFDGRRTRADLADDRRRSSPRTSGSCRRATTRRRVRARTAGERGQARGPAVDRAVARGEVLDREGQGRRVLEQPGARRSEGDDPRGRVPGQRRCRLASTRQYVLEFLDAVDTDQVALELKDEVSQAVMKPVGAGGYDYIYVIMPMRV